MKKGKFDQERMNMAKIFISNFSQWVMHRQLLYGDYFDEWWETKGGRDFVKWAKNKYGIEYVQKINKEEILK